MNQIKTNMHLHCKIAVLSLFILLAENNYGQDLLGELGSNTAAKEYVTGAFKSSRVINNHSVEFIGKGVLDVRILHRFGLLNSGFSNLYGLDQATMRLGFDYGISKNLTVGIGRSTFEKEWDGLVKWRLVQQSAGLKAFPLSVVWVSGMTISTIPVNAADPKKSLGDRTGYYHELILGRKFNSLFSLQLNTKLVHRNLVAQAGDKNDVYATGAGARLKLSRRIALVADYDYVLSGLAGEHSNPLALGFDIETGGHVFQLHFSNTEGLNERAFITQTSHKWSKGDINFGFNLSRVFTVRKKR